MRTLALVFALAVPALSFGAVADVDRLSELEYARADAMTAKRQALQLQLQILDAEQQAFLSTLAKDHKMGPDDGLDWAKRTVVRAPKKK